MDLREIWHYWKEKKSRKRRITGRSSRASKKWLKIMLIYTLIFEEFHASIHTYYQGNMNRGQQTMKRIVSHIAIAYVNVSPILRIPSSKHSSQMFPIVEWNHFNLFYTYELFHPIPCCSRRLWNLSILGYQHNFNIPITDSAMKICMFVWVVSIEESDDLLQVPWVRLRCIAFVDMFVRLVF